MEYVAMALALMFVTKCVVESVPDIREYKENQYCETKKVSGKEITECLKAFEVDEEGNLK